MTKLIRTLSAVIASLTLSSIGFAQANLTTPVDQTIPAITSKAPSLKPDVLKLALTAYNCAVENGYGKKKKLTIIDYSMPETKKRMWVIDLNTDKIVFNSLVAHGEGSGGETPTHFSNTPETHESSLGLFMTGDTYFGQDGYSLHLHGLERGFNDHAYSRSVVIHGAWYVNEEAAREGYLGRTWGCPAVPERLAQPIVDTIKNGSLIFAYYPNSKWLKHSQFLHCSPIDQA
jgi:hypothetical protein